MKRSLLLFSFAVLLAAASAPASALPDVAQVRTAVAQGHYGQAEAMMREVIAAKPASARAHYVLAEILAHERRFGEAAAQAQRAAALDPSLAFTEPAKFRAFAGLLDREQAAERGRTGGSAAPTLGGAVAGAAPAAQAAPARVGSGVPGWAWAIGLGVVGWLLVRAFAARRPAAMAPAYAPAVPGAMPGGAAAGPYGPGVGVPPAPGGGLLGTGMAVAGGVAAGLLAERLFDGRGGASPGSNATGLFPGLNPGPVDSSPIDDAAQRALQDNPVDFGNGGDNWDSGADPGGAGDAGGGSDGW